MDTDLSVLRGKAIAVLTPSKAYRQSLASFKIVKEYLEP